MAPVLALVLGTAAVAALSMRFIGERHLKVALAATDNACDYADVYMARGTVLMERLRERAGHIIVESIAPDDPSLGVLEGDSLVEDAREAYERAVELCPDKAEAYMQLAVVEWYGGRELSSYLHLGSYLLRNDRPDEAAINYRVALEQDPGSLPARIGLARALRETGRAGEAMELLAPHGDELRGNAEGLITLGLVSMDSGRPEEAWDALRTGLELSPANREALLAMSALASVLSRDEEVANFFHTLDEGGRRGHPQGFHLASIHFRILGDHAMEERALRKALALAPNQVSLHFDLAVALHRQGKRSAARDAVRRALEIDSGHVLARIEESGVDPR